MWSSFEQSPLEDETITNAFSSRGIFKISSDEEVGKYPLVQASVQNSRMIISIDKNIVLLEDEMKAKCSSLSFNAEIDVVTISRGGNLIVCGLSDGEIHGIYINGILLFNACIKVEDVHMTGRTFVSVQQVGNRFHFTCTNGSSYCLSEVDEKTLESNPNLMVIENNESVANEKNILDDVLIHRTAPARAIGGLTTSVLLNTTNTSVANASGAQAISNMLLAASNHLMHFRYGSSDNLSHITMPTQFCGLKRIFNIDHFVLALTNSGHLIEICPFTRTFDLRQSFGEDSTNFLIEDLLVMENNNDNVELLVLTKIMDGGRLIKIIDYPYFKCKSELEVFEHSWLVSQPKSSVNLYYLCSKKVNKDSLPIEVEMVLVSETDPSDRFKKLIAKGHLEEAELFGVQFELSLQPIYEARAKRILIELSTDKNPSSDHTRENFQKMLALLSKIESTDFFKNHRMINLPSRQFLDKYLREILIRLDSKDDENEIFEINEQLHRLKTLQIIDPYECDGDWQKFVYNTNLIKVIISLFVTDMPTACLIWKRHSYCITPHLSEEKLCKLLRQLPNNTDAFNVVQWLRQFIPTVSNTHPGIMSFIADWSIEKTRALQYAEHWPDIGLEFCTKILEIFEDIEILYTDVRRKHEQNISKLRDLVNILQELSVLKTSYNLIFSLDNYMQDSLDETTLCVLQKVHLEKLHGLVNDFLFPIFQEKGKSPVNAIKHYVTKLVASRNSVSNWLQRAVSCIELLHNIDDRLESALLVLQRSPVPWPDSVAPLIKLRSSSHPLALKINAEYEVHVIKIMAVKYGWAADSVTNKTMQLFMMRVVSQNLPDMIDDIRVLTEAAPVISTSANFNCCYQMARRGQIDQAYQFFKSLKSGKNPKYADDVIEILAGLLENVAVSSTMESDKLEEENNVCEFFQLIIKHAGVEAESRYLAIKNQFVLRRKFGLKLNADNKFVSHNVRLALLEEGIGGILERSQAQEDICEFITVEVSELCAALYLQKTLGFHCIFKRLKCLPLSCALAYYVNSSVDCVAANKEDFVSLGLELIAQQIILAKRNHSMWSMQLLSQYDPLAFPLAYELLTSALTHENKRQRDLYELVKYVRIANASYPLNAVSLHYDCGQKSVNEQVRKALEGAEINLGNVALNFSTVHNTSLEAKPVLPKKRLSVSVFEDIDVQPQKQKPCISSHLPVVKFVARTLLLMVLETEPSNALLQQLRKALPQDVEQDIESAREDFFISLEKLIKAKDHDSWYIMAQYLLDYQNQNKCKNIINKDFVSLQLRRFFRNAMMQKDVNFIELFAMLIADCHAKSLLDKLSSDVKSDQQKINLLTLSEMYSVRFDEKNNVEAIRSKRMKHFYYMEFCQKNPTIRGKFNADVDNIDQLLKEFHNKQLDVHLLERMSRDFGFDYQKILIAQIMSILSSQQMQYEIKTDVFGVEELVMLSNVQEMRDMCQPYINEVKNNDLLTSKLQQFIDEINIYFYELYMCVIEILMFFDAVPKGLEIWSNILHFLKHKMTTRRCNRPGQLETDAWLKSQKEIGLLPKIARYRLPFKPIVEQPLKCMLDNELNVDNCQSWFPLIQMHTSLKGSTKVSQICDYFCMSAVKNSIAEYKSKNELETWNLHPTNNAFLKSILRLVNDVRNPCKAFLILYFVSSYAPDGADQVEASYECWKYVLANEALLTDPKYQDQLSKIKRKYPIVKTQHLLYGYGLTDEKLLRLVENPNELIHCLYNHELILKGGKLDINSLVGEIAKLYDLDLEIIQYKLLQKWLSFTSEPVDGSVMEETFFEDQNIPENGSSESALNESENVIRANYILRSWPKEEAEQFLISHILNPDGVTNTSEQLQMFECISKLDDGSSSFNKMLSQREYITTKCVHDLKALGYKSSVEKFADNSCNKIDILKIIWRNHSQNTLTLEVMANICLGFDIHIPQIWNGILKRMIMFNMIPKLNALVEILSCNPKLIQMDGLALAWDCVLQHPFKNANQLRSFAHEEPLHKTLLRLQTCPVVHALNLLQFVEACMLSVRPHMAAIVLTFCKNSEELQAIKNLILTRKTNKLREEILALEDAGILPVILNFALKELNL